MCETLVELIPADGVDVPTRFKNFNDEKSGIGFAQSIMRHPTTVKVYRVANLYKKRGMDWTFFRTVRSES